MNEQANQINPFDDGTALRAMRGLPSFEEALARLVHTAEHGRPFGVVRGPAGTGVSTLLNAVADEFRRSATECGHIDLRLTSADELAWHLAVELGAAPTSLDRNRCWRLVQDCLLGRALAARLTVLLIDHVESADSAVISELHRLIAIAKASAGWCTVLCGGRSLTPGVDAMIREHAELRIELGPLDEAETCSFLQTIITDSGCTPFAEEAALAIYTRTQGILREILQLGRLSLLAAFSEDADLVTADIVTMVAGEVPGAAPARRLRRSAATRLAAAPPEDAVAM